MNFSRFVLWAAALLLPAAGYQDSDPKIANKDFQQQLDLLIYRLNTAGLVAKVLDLRGKTDDAKSLRSTMREMDKALTDLLAKMKSQGHDPFVPDHVKPDDFVTHLDSHNFAKMDSPQAEKILVGFVAGIKAGTRARIIVKRGQDWFELDVRYHSRPKELFTIYQVAGIVPGSEVASETPAASPSPSPEPEFDAWGMMADPAKRVVMADRTRGSIVLATRAKASRCPNVVAFAAVYLALPDAEWKLDGAGAAAFQSYLDRSKLAEIEKYDGARHLSVLAALAPVIADLRTKDADGARFLAYVAAAHAADALLTGAAEAEVAKLLPKAGLRRSSDGRRFGEDPAMLVLDLAREAAGLKVQNAMGRFASTWKSHPHFPVRYAGALLVVLETFDRNSGGYEACHKAVKSVAAEGGPEAAAHLNAIADRIQQLAKCGQCENGRVKCPKCGGDNKMDVKCTKCDGNGRIEKGGGTIMCQACRGEGVFRNVECSCGKTGNKVECPACKGKVWLAKLPSSSISEIFTMKDCPGCAGKGTLVPNVALTCPFCDGLGKTVFPTGDPEKTLKR